jgi:hypothetical protein
MRQPPSLQDVELFVRDFARLRASYVLHPQTRLDADLGITGDDGDELLQRASKHFGVSLANPTHGYRETFSLAEDEFLFHGEGHDLLGISRLLQRLLKVPPQKVRDLTIAELHDAILRTKLNETPPNKSLERTREE